MNQFIHRKSKGFTLLEVLITVVVLATGLVLVLQVLQNVISILDRGVQRTRNVMTAQEAFSRARHEGTLGIVPQSGDGIRVEGNVRGHEGLFRLIQEDPERSGRVYQMLLYVSPEDDASL